MDSVSRSEIVETLAKFVNNDYARVFEKEFFYFNKRAIVLTNVDEMGKSFGAKSLKLAALKLETKGRSLTEFMITEYDAARFGSLSERYEQEIKPFVDALDYKEQKLVVTTKEGMVWFDGDQETIVRETLGKRETLGCGKIVVKAAMKKATKTQIERIEITVELAADTQKDYEIIPFCRDEDENVGTIAAFMAKYITKPFEYLETVVGVEINFNKVFYQPETLRSVEEILGEIAALDEELRKLEAQNAR